MVLLKLCCFYFFLCSINGVVKVEYYYGGWLLHFPVGSYNSGRKVVKVVKEEAFNYGLLLKVLHDDLGLKDIKKV